MLKYGFPALFVLIWSTGFITGRYAKPRADLELFALLRFMLVALAMGSAALATRAAWPRGREFLGHLLAGSLMLGVYIGASYWAITHGMAAGVMALLGALQPLFTALFLATTGVKLATRAWLGLAIGIAGVACVLAPRLAMTGAGSLTVASVTAAIVSVMAVTAGTLVQKWYPRTDLRAAQSVQNLGGAAIAACACLLVGTGQWDNSAPLWGALMYAVIVLSIIGTSILVWMIRHGDATKVTALVLLAPPLAAVQGFLFFGETLLPLQFVGFGLALVGVLLARS
jgi:drug/metabolite transporter (DMT)-like permease